MARPRNKRSARSVRKRPAPSAQSPIRTGTARPQDQVELPAGSPPEIEGREAEAVAEVASPEAAKPETVPSRPGSLLPRRNQKPTPVRPEPVTSAPGPQAVAAPSLLPKKARPAGRAEQRRRQEANLEPMDESPAVPMDRTPYLSLDIGRVVITSTVMLVLVLVGWLFIH